MKIKVAAIQMQSIDNKEANLSKAKDFVRKAAEMGAKLIVLPEIFNFWGPPEIQKESAEPIPGPTSNFLSELAKESNAYLLGGILEKAEGEKSFNACLLFDPEGEMIAKYRKIHLFDVDIKDQLRVMESDTTLPGKEIVTSDLGFCKAGLSICYDLRFPELYRALSARGANLVFVPSSFMAHTGKDHWEVLLRARAIENQCFIIAANETGPIPGANRLRYGNSMIIDPWGKILARASDKEEVITAELDFDYLSQVRKQLPALDHRKI